MSNLKRKFAALSLFIFAVSNFPVNFSYAQEAFPEGSLWRASGDDRIYVISNDRKRHILNAAVFSSYGWKMVDVQETDPDILFGIPDIRVIKTADSPAIFDIISGQRMPFHSAEEFLADGFSWDEIAVVNGIELSSYPPETPSSAPEPLSTPTTSKSILVKKIAEARKLLHEASPVYPQERRVVARKYLAAGASGPDIELVQEKLQELGHFPKTIESNGNFGPATVRAVKAFQRSQGILQNGVVGPQTATALEKKGMVFPASGAGVRSWRAQVPTGRGVLLAAWHKETDTLQLVHITLGSQRVKVGKKFRTVSKVTTQTPGFTVHYKSGNGVNVQYAITSPPGYQVLANRFPIFDAASNNVGSFPPREEVYVPYSDEFQTPEIVEAGWEYLDYVVTEALQDLKIKGIQSASSRGLVADLTAPDELKNIALIEHIDPAEFRKTEDKRGVMNKVFTILGTNREDAYKFSGSSKGALGLAQFIRNTYASIRKQYPAAELLPGFADGMANHINAIKAMALYHDVTGATLESFVREKITADPTDLAFALAEVRAAAYNGGAGRVKTALKKYGSQWAVASSRAYGLRNETKTYLEKFRVVRQILKQ